MPNLNYPLDILPEVQHALDNNLPVVALESTIISHGMPWPQNAETALRVSNEIRSFGAIPATIAVIEGRLKAGLTQDQIELLAKSGSQVMKCSRRDLPFVVSNKKMGATTVASTMIIAEMAGIKVFATGGIGGVHRGAELTMDISADLTELGRTSVAVVCAGAKSILDLRLTLEFLETQGVPVIGYKTSKLPAFYTRTSEHSVDFCLDSAAEIAQFLQQKWLMDLKGGAVIANPIPIEFAIDPNIIENHIQAALKDCQANGVSGKETTPFLLKRVSELTKGKSLEANIELVLNNARLAAKIAEELVKF